MSKTIQEIIASSPLECWIERGYVSREDVRSLCRAVQFAAFGRAAEAISQIETTTPDGEQVKTWCVEAIRSLRPE